MTGLDRFGMKERRKMRRQNHDLLDKKTKPHRPKPFHDDYEHWSSNDWLNHLDDFYDKE